VGLWKSRANRRTNGQATAEAAQAPGGAREGAGQSGRSPICEHRLNWPRRVRRAARFPTSAPTTARPIPRRSQTAPSAACPVGPKPRWVPDACHGRDLHQRLPALQIHRFQKGGFPEMPSRRLSAGSFNPFWCSLCGHRFFPVPLAVPCREHGIEPSFPNRRSRNYVQTVTLKLTVEELRLFGHSGVRSAIPARVHRPKNARRKPDPAETDAGKALVVRMRLLVGQADGTSGNSLGSVTGSSSGDPMKTAGGIVDPARSDVAADNRRAKLRGPASDDEPASNRAPARFVGSLRLWKRLPW